MEGLRGEELTPFAAEYGNGEGPGAIPHLIEPLDQISNGSREDMVGLRT
jgi:hypothetical protein